MYELMARFWPTADADPASTGPMVEFARIWRDMPKIVFSRTLERADWNTTVVRELVPGEIRRLKAQPGGDMTLGGADLAAAFMRHDLIDEYRLYVHPIVIGRGKPLFQPSDATVKLRLAETRMLGPWLAYATSSQPDLETADAELLERSSETAPAGRPRARGPRIPAVLDRGAAARYPSSRPEAVVLVKYFREHPEDPPKPSLPIWNASSSACRSGTSSLPKDRRIVTLDLAGHGESGRDRKEWTIPAFGQDVRAALSGRHDRTT